MSKNISSFKYYYRELISHSGVTTHDSKAAKKYLTQSIILIVILLILCTLFILYKDSAIVCYFTNGLNILFCIYAIMFVYAVLALASYTLYHIISYRYEDKNKHELNEAEIKGIYKLYYAVFIFIHLPWILLSCLIQKILEFFRIQSLKEYLPMIICGYLYFLIIAIFIFQLLCKCADVLIEHYTFLTNAFVTETTHLYIIMFISIIVSKNIPTLALKIVLHPFIAKNSSDYKKIFRQYHLLNYYILVFMTLVLKALDFTDKGEILIDALFYTTNALTLFSTIKERVKNAA